MEEDNRRKTNIDKANKRTIIPILILMISCITYIEPLIYGEFDFGIIFEMISLILIFVAKGYMKKYNEKKAKKTIIIAILPVLWLFIYDFIIVINSIKDYGLEAIVFFAVGELLSVIYITCSYYIYKDLDNANEPIDEMKNKNWYYEKNDNNGGPNNE